MKLIDRESIKQKVQEKLIKACGRYYESERALCEITAPQSWIDEEKDAYCEFIQRYQDYQLVFEDNGDITYDDLNYDDYETN